MIERGIAENNGPFIVERVDGKWFDAAIAHIPELRKIIGPIPDEWVTGILPERLS